MFSFKKWVMLVLCILCLTLTSAAQDSAPAQPSQSTDTPQEPQIAPTRGTRDVVYASYGNYWYGSSPNLPWNGNNLRYTIADSGPGAGAYIHSFQATYTGCMIAPDAQTLHCSFGNAIPPNIMIYVGYTIAYPDGVNWSSTEVWAGAAYHYTTTLVPRPYDYASNLLLDSSAETQKLPNWSKNGASRACNTETKIVASDGACAIKLDNNTENAAQIYKPEIPINGGFIVWVSYDVMGKSLDTPTKVFVYWTDIHNKTRKIVIQNKKGTFVYTDLWTNVRVNTVTKKLRIKVVGGKGGKTYYDDLELLVINLADLTR